MNLSFEFATSGQIFFGPGVFSQAGIHAQKFGTRVFLVAGYSGWEKFGLLKILNGQNLDVDVFVIRGEPSLATVSAARAQAEAFKPEVIIGFGGGSAMDGAKAIAALLTNEGPIIDYLEVIGNGKPLRQTPLPVIAIPTTAGTGSEVTRNAVIGSPDHQVKVSLRHPAMLPRVALVDPELTYDLPPAVTAFTGLDALTQNIEPYVSIAANPLTDGFCRTGILAARSLPTAYQDGHDPTARTDMSLASLMGGLALANAKLGAVHGFAGPFGGLFDAPHGAVCGRLLPAVMESNIRALSTRLPESPALERYREIAVWLTDDPDASAWDGVIWVRELVERVQLPGLADYGLARNKFPELIDSAQRASSMKGNPIPLTDEELADILQQSL